MANIDYTYDNIRDGVVTGSFKVDGSSTASPSVKRLQTKLNRAGFNCGKADGKFGSNTKAQVIAFQKAYSLDPDGCAGKNTLKKLDIVSPDSSDELLGRELTHAELTGAASSMSSVEALARTIYGEDSIYSEGQSAVAREIYNRKTNTQYSFGSLCPANKTRTWKNVVYDTPKQYTVMTGSSSDTKLSRGPDQYSESWLNCVSIARDLVNGKCPTSSLGKRFFHIGKGFSYPSNTYNHLQIPKEVGNKFYNNSTTKIG